MAIAIDNGVIYTGISVFRPFARVRWQRGHTDVATISVAVLIGESGTSAANAPLLKQGNLRDGSPCPALSEMFRSASCFFFSAVVSLSARRNYNPDTEYPNFHHLATCID